MRSARAGGFGKQQSGSGTVEPEAPLEHIVELQHCGAILSKLERQRRSTWSMGRDGFMQMVA